MSPTGIRGATSPPLLATCVMGLLALAAWLLRHPFAGMTHDSLLYTLFALVRLHPDTVGADVVVRFGSQDRFTIFSPIYTAAIQLSGVQHAAALLLVTSQAVFLTCAWLLARRFMARLDATLGLGLLVVVPGEYGSGSVFHILENFLTARMPAEALVVAAILAALSARYWIGAACMAAAIAIHPIMGAAGAAFMALCFGVPLRPRLAATLATAGFAVALGVVLAIAPLGRLVDPDWARALSTEVPYLFILNWSIDDWSRIAVPLAVLAIGWRTGSMPLLRRVCASALGMVASGLVITLVFVDLLHVWWVMSLQAWRWLWLADVLAFLLAPAVLKDCWQRGVSGRIAVVAVAIAWVLSGPTAHFLATAAALALAAVPVGRAEQKNGRLLFLGATLVLGLAIVSSLADRLLYLANDSRGDSLLQQVRTFCGDGVIPMGVFALAWALLHRTEGSRRTYAAAIALMVLVGSSCVWLLTCNWPSYAAEYYTPKLAELFAPWRAAIPPRAEVLWPETALSSWYLLERPSYWSAQQVAGGLFSRDQAIIMEHRTGLLRTVMRNSGLLVLNGTRQEVAKAEQTALPNVAHMDANAFRAICADSELQYVVSRTPLGSSPFPPVIDLPSRINGKLYLYRCADLRPR